MRGEGDSLKDNFSYFDMLAYLAPGSVLLWAGQQGLLLRRSSTYFQMENWAFGSLVGLVLAYVLGQLVSARGSVRFGSGRRSETVCRHGRISENFLLQGHSVYGKVLCKEPRRLTLVEMAKKHCDLSVLEAEHLDKWKENLDAAQETSHEVYRPLLTLLTDEKIGEKAMTMSLRYMFFRNLSCRGSVWCITIPSFRVLQLHGRPPVSGSQDCVANHTRALICRDLTCCSPAGALRRHQPCTRSL